MYPEIEKQEKMENTWDPSRNSCEALIVPKLDATKHWKLSMTNAVRAMGLGTLVNPIGYLGVQGTQASYFLKSKFITFSCHHEISVLYFVQFGNP